MSAVGFGVGAEQIDVPDAALALIARSGEGSMRDAQSAFDQVIAFAGATLVADDVATVLGYCMTQYHKRVEKLVPYLVQSEDQVPGVPTWYASTYAAQRMAATESTGAGC